MMEKIEVSLCIRLCLFFPSTTLFPSLNLSTNTDNQVLLLKLILNRIQSIFDCRYIWLALSNSKCLVASSFLLTTYWHPSSIVWLRGKIWADQKWVIVKLWALVEHKIRQCNNGYYPTLSQFRYSYDTLFVTWLEKVLHTNVNSWWKAEDLPAGKNVR